MSPEAQRLAIAEACGWRLEYDTTQLKAIWIVSPKSGYHYAVDDEFIPDYLKDLNAMHEAEKTLTVNQWTDYLDALDKICVPVHICPTTHAMSVYCATAQQRAEAFLRTLNLWTEEKGKSNE